MICRIHEDSRATCGMPQVHAELVARGWRVSRKRVARLMRKSGLVGVSRRRGTRTTRGGRSQRAAPDRVQRQFRADAPKRIWVADITYVPTWTGFMYLAVVLDVFSRKVVGWAIANHLRTEVVLGALNMAIGQRSTAVRLTRRTFAGPMMTHPGMYCLRSNETGWDEATLWRTYFTLTDLEAVFRSLKSELGLCPTYHHKPIPAEGHLVITVIAYQLVQVIRTRLRQAGKFAAWTTLRRILEGQQRITATCRRADGATWHVRKATRAEPPQRVIYDALGIRPAPGGIRKIVVQTTLEHAAVEPLADSECRNRMIWREIA